VPLCLRGKILWRNSDARTPLDKADGFGTLRLWIAVREEVQDE